MKIIITGSTGFVGAHLVRYYSKQGHEVLALGRQKNPPEALKRFAQWQQLDLSAESYPILNADVFIHAAGISSDRGDYKTFYEANVKSSIKLFNQFHGGHFIYISSASVYPSLEIPLKESLAGNQAELSHYGRSKLAAENSLLESRDWQTKLTILRPRAIYGTHDRVLLPKMLKLLKNKILLLGDMNIEISMTHINNLIKAIDASLSRQTESRRIYNVADDKTYVLKEVVNLLLSSVAGKKMETKKISLALLKGLTKITSFLGIPFPLTKQSLDYLSQSCILDTRKIKSQLQIQFTENFYEELSQLSKWVSRVGRTKVESSHPELPWLGVRTCTGCISCKCKRLIKKTG